MFKISLFLLLWAASTAAGTSSNGPIESCAHWLARHGIPLTHEGLIAALNNEDADIRVNAAQQLADNKEKDAIPFIRESAAREQKFTNRSNMALFLAQLGDSSGSDFLKAYCSNLSAPAWERLHAANNMLTLRSDACFPDVLSILQSSTNAEVIVQALDFCFNAKYQLEDEGNQTSPPDKQRHELVVELVGKRISDPDDSVRTVAGDILAKVGDSSQAHILEDAISRETNDGIKADMQKDLDILLAKPPAQ